MLEQEGWTYLINSPKWHYFVGNRSICSRFMLLSLPELEQGKEESPDNCKACKTKLLKRKSKKELSDGQ